LRFFRRRQAADIRWARESLRLGRAQLEADAERRRVEFDKCWSARARDPIVATGYRTHSFFSHRMSYSTLDDER
jgi:hypothetical protein